MFNVELYIEKCLLSCLHQDVPSSEYEIVVVNDGSPDNSLQIAEHIASTVDNVTVVSQENGGLSVARNTGLLHAKGEYVWFVDSDDWIEENCLAGILKRLDKTQPDFLQLQYRLAYDDESKDKDVYCTVDGVVSGVQQINNGDVPHPAQFAIYRKNFLIENNLLFYPGIFHEDSEFKPRVLFLAKRCASYDKVVYNYYQRSVGSITSMPNPKRAFDCLKVALSIDDFFVNITKGECAPFFHNHISLMINNALSVVGDRKIELARELYMHKHLFVHLRKSSILKYKIEGFLFTLFPHRTISIYCMLQNFNN